MKVKKIIAISSVAALTTLAVTSCSSTEEDGYTYHSYSTSLGKNWNPHAWENSSEQTMLDYITSPFVDISIKDSNAGVYQWVYEMATSITDVTKDHKSDLTTYGSELPKGKTLDQVESGYVYEFKLNENAKWENGEKINADSYIDSMKLLLEPTMKNYRANNYISGTTALAGAFDYYYQGENYGPATLAYDEYDVSLDSKLTFHWKEENSKKTDVLALMYGDYKKYWDGLDTLTEGINSMWPDSLSLTDDKYAALDGLTLSEIKADADKAAAYAEVLAWWGEGEAGNLQLCATTYMKDAVDYSKVGLYKVDDYTFRYVTKSAVDINYFLTSCTSTWLVYKPLYEAGYDTTGKLKTTNYCTSKETTMAYGPYKLESFEAGKQMVFTQNENWYGYTKNEETGKLESFTQFEVDGEKRRQYQTTKIVVDVLTDAAAKQKFMKGELDDWTPEAADLTNYTTSSQLYKVDETYQMSFFFNTNLAALQTMDSSKGNKNSVVLSNDKFRKAMSLSFDRTEWVTATQGYKPAYSLLSSLYFYDAFDNPESIYRNTEQAMKAIVDLYGVEYGEGKTYKTLEEAHKSINGYDLAQAKTLMKEACDELVDAGLYTRGEEIKIRVAYKKGALDATDNAQIALINKYVNAALAGSGFGQITFEAVGNLTDRYKAVPSGDYAIGYGAWGGGAFEPFGNFRLYFDPEYTDVNEIACWDPTTDTITIEVKGTPVTKTYQEWSTSMEGTGEYADEDFEVKLNILSTLENAFLSKYYRIPLASSTSCSMLSYKVNYYTENYNIMYGFGGIRLLSYNYNDGEWANYVAEQGGTLNYAS